MWGLTYVLAGCLFIAGGTGTDSFHRSGRGMCLVNRQHTPSLPYTESYVQPVYQPYLMACEGHRICSSYRTTYKVAYRQGLRRVSQPLYTCCPGWKKISAQTHSCSKGLCRLPCQHGGLCAGIDRCGCPPGWGGKYCQSDVDECSGVSHGCSHLCVNTAGSYQCACREGHALVADGKMCRLVGKPPGSTAAPPPATHSSGASDNTKDEMQALKSRMETVEQKLQLLLAPLHSLLPSTSDDISTDTMSLLSHSFQQLDRIDSLSEQISFLEERLETCSCKKEL
ncbi:epidermal growth factor-like protein 7 [Ambystoma mexicanum]|uniref:epidermal growth factor-like protein 7 n=1 Tax=Ambystoma mexicanum TaxID=8296 RepID=UPI0037E9790F